MIDQNSGAQHPQEPEDCRSCSRNSDPLPGTAVERDRIGCLRTCKNKRSRQHQEHRHAEPADRCVDYRKQRMIQRKSVGEVPNKCLDKQCADMPECNRKCGKHTEKIIIVFTFSDVRHRITSGRGAADWGCPLLPFRVPAVPCRHIRFHRSSGSHPGAE